MEDGDRLVYRIVTAAHRVHEELGPGFQESIYGRALVLELKQAGLRMEREKVVRIWYGSQLVGKHRLDLVVEGAVVIELKANRSIVQAHTSQMRSYLQATRYAQGVILNFGMPEWERLRREDWGYGSETEGG
jgi:GxxExxY protein